MDKLLFLSRWFPYPADNGARLRCLNLLRELSAYYAITLVSFRDADDTNPDSIPALRELCTAVYTVPTPNFNPQGLAGAVALFSARPRSVVASDSQPLRQLLARLCAVEQFDVVIAATIDMAPYAMTVPARQRVLEEIEISLLTSRLGRVDPLSRARLWLTVQKQRRYLARLARSFTGFTTVSAVEQAEIERWIGRLQPMAVIPNGVSLPPVGNGFGSPQPNVVTYSGAITYFANLDAVSHYLEDILPLVRAAVPEARLQVTGKAPADLVARLPLAGLPEGAVELTGYLADVRPCVAQSWLTVVPLRLGGGTRLKILESLALGTPVVSTTKGVEGLDLVPGRDLLVADDPQAFAGHVIQVLTRPELRARLSAAGRAAVACYDWSAIGRRYLKFLEELSRVSPPA